MRALIFLLFFASGIAALAYQMVWTKLLTLVFGVTFLAVSTVLTCFFGGLALGSFLGGRWIEGHRNGFFWYGLAEILVGIYAMLFGLFLAINNSAYVYLAQTLASGFAGLTLIKFILSAILLIIPTTLMGATLPILSKTLARGTNSFAWDIGGLYSINTLGAVTGAILTAFVFIPSFGLSAILYGAGILNFIIGFSAIMAGKSYGAAVEITEAPQERPALKNQTVDGPEGPLPSGFNAIVLWGFALSGFTGLAYEVIWTRVLGFILTGTVYAFAVVLAVFLSGIALGSFAVSSFLDKVERRSTVVYIFSIVEVLIGLTSIALIILYDKLPSMGFYATLDLTPDWGEFIYLNFFTSFITLFIPTFLFGATFPLVCKIYDWSAKSVGKKIGNIYSLNTIGGILGSFISGFVFIPFIGMQKAIILTGGINILIGLVVAIFNPTGKNTARYAIPAAGIVAMIILILGLPANMPLSLHKSLLRPGEDIIYYKEGATATVMIAERRGAGLEASNKRLWVNGNRATAAYYEGLQINRFQGVLPMSIHPNPKDILVICFGSGTTFGTLSQFPVTKVDNVEIARAVIQGASYFKDANMDVLHNPVSRINIDDGRSFLAVTEKKFDVITEEPMHPALAGVVNLYTKEYYELAKAHLKKDGIISQWIPLYNLSVEDVRLMVRTFQSVFPHTSIWLANTDIFMIGSPEELTVDYDVIKAKLNMPNIKKLLSDIDLEDPVEFMTTFLMNEDMVAKYAGTGAVMTDNNPVVEFTGPKSLHVNTISPNIAELVRYREPVYPYLRLSIEDETAALNEKFRKKYFAVRLNLIGRAYFADSNFPKAAQYFSEALKIDPTDRNSLHYRRKLKIF
ncbi:MAG: fused MFS/spermidine synthase [Thermodesulfobacteriota bacterium]